METKLIRLISSAIAALGLAWAASARAQELNIEVPVPSEPARISANGKQPPKPIPLRRIEPLKPDRRDTSEQLRLAAPSFNPAGSRPSPLEPENTGSDTLREAVPNSLPVAPLEGPAANDSLGLGREPAWANPVSIPIRQNERPEDGAKPRARAKQRAGIASSDLRSAATRAGGPEAGPAPRLGLLNFGARLAARRAANDESAPLLARRHRTETRERNGRQPPPHDTTSR